MKPYAVAVIIGEKASTKEFDTKEEFTSFLKKAEELKSKAPRLEVKVLRKPNPKVTTGKKATHVIIDDPREDSLCWRPIKRNGRRAKDFRGNYLYHCIPVPRKNKNTIYCPYCNGYKDLKLVDIGYGLNMKGCTDCGITLNDFYMKTANSLWKGVANG